MRSAAPNPASQRLAGAIAGAPLDLIKAAAAVAMVADHTNKILFGLRYPSCWFVGRAAFPLFVFAIAAHLLRGTQPWPYLQRLVLLAVISQPAYAIGFRTTDPNTIFTLAAGVAVVALLAARSRPVQHFTFAVGVAAILTPWLRARSGLDFGLAGILFPAVLVLTIEEPPTFGVWLMLYGFLLSYFPENSFPVDLAVAAATVLGMAAVVALALTLRGRPRFLPGYAFYAFYPAHLLVLGLIRPLIQ